MGRAYAALGGPLITQCGDTSLFPVDPVFSCYNGGNPIVLPCYPASPVLTVTEFGVTWTLEAPGVARTNRISTGNWVGQGSGTGVPPIITVNAGVAPDGTVTATHIQLDHGTGAAFADASIAYVGAGTLAAGNWCWSLWIKNQAASPVTFSIYANIAPTAATTLTLSAGEGRWVVYLFSESGSTPETLRIRINAAQQQTADLLVWSPMVESGTTAGRRIAPNTTVTDVTSYDPATGQAVLGADATNLNADGQSCTGGPTTWQVPASVIATYDNKTGAAYTSGVVTDLRADSIACAGSGQSWRVPLITF